VYSFLVKEKKQNVIVLAMPALCLSEKAAKDDRS
jgi:hypothetical protein